jgi:hypothetical protein
MRKIQHKENCGLLYTITLEGHIKYTSQSQSYVMTDSQSASLPWNKVPIWGLRPGLYYCQTVAGLLMWGTLSDERWVCCLPESQSEVISLLSVCTINILHVIKCMYIQHIQGLLHQSRLSTADHALSYYNLNCCTSLRLWQWLILIYTIITLNVLYDYSFIARIYILLTCSTSYGLRT